MEHAEFTAIKKNILPFELDQFANTHAGVGEDGDSVVSKARGITQKQFNFISRKTNTAGAWLLL